MALARAEGHRLGFWDGQYRTAPPVRMARLRPGAVRRARAKSDPDALADAVRAQLHETITDIAVTTWLIPLGLHPGDHELVARSTLDLARDLPEIDWLVYEELPYRVEDPVKAASALRRLEESAEWSLEQVQLEGDPDLSEKRAMVECHRSQMGALGDRVRLAVEGPEAFHRLRRADVRREP
jgi:LmbE family N-acetylglucosaminyl deacetylase